jgi:signal transduction histidine kinase/ActR/RegA family two-component response regulator
MVPSRSSAGEVPDMQEERKRQVYAEQIRLLYANANVGVEVTVLVASILAYLQWPVIPHPTVLGWLVYVALVSALRYGLARAYRRPSAKSGKWWGNAFAVSAGLSGAGWGGASILLYPPEQLTHQVFLAFVLGGVMLGAVSLLAPRPESFLAFLLPAALPTAVRFLAEGDRIHIAMGLLATLFTVSILATTRRIYLTIGASLALRFENQDLVDGLRLAKQETEALNQKLEVRVTERTVELHEANERLRAEMEQRKRAEDELLRARKLEALGVLAGGIAHDFNNFLTIVQGNLGLARMELERGHPVSDILEQTLGACEHAASLASQLLTFGKGGAPVRLTVSADKLIKDSVNLTAAGANVNIDVTVADNLWALDIDASQISHALQNILLNARQAMPEGGRIEVRAENLHLDDDLLPVRPGKYVRVSVRDFGCGIPPDILPRVFDPYFTTKPSGSGLGLAAAFAIVSKHQGHIAVQSTVGVETTFSIYLPASGKTLPPTLPSAEPVHTGSGRILVMDDESAIRQLVARMLERFGYEAEGAKDGEEAIALFQAAKAAGRGFDAVLLDLTVPGGMGGADAAIKLREIDPSVPLVVTSGYAHGQILSEYQKHGFDAVLRKPWTVAELGQVFKQVRRRG